MQRRVAFLAIVLSLAATFVVSGQDRWSPLSPMYGGRWSLAAATGPDGKIYVVGGQSPGGRVTRLRNELEAYDGSTRSWMVMAPMPTARAGLSAAAGLDGRIYAIGGFGASGRTVEAYDPAVNEWFHITEMPTGRAFAAAAAGSDGRLYVIGGISAGNIPLDTVEAYDPAAGRWTALAPMPTPRYALAAATSADGRIYVMGGASEAGTLQTVESYDPSTNSWAAAAPMPTARYGLGAAVGVDGRIYAVGGADEATVLDVAESYEPAANRWSAVAPLRHARQLLAVAAGLDGKVYAIGGSASGSPVNAVEIYGPGSDLETTAVTDPPAVVVLKQKLSITDTVQNHGLAASATTTRYFFSLDTVKGAGDKALGGKRAVSALAAGASSTGTGKATVATSTKLGLYYLLVCADALNVEAETDESNNCRASTTQVEVRAPDLNESAVGNPPASASPGDGFMASDTVVNQGNAASGPTTSRFYFSLDTKKSGSDVLLGGTRLVPGLAPGANSAGNQMVTVPASTTPGMYFLIACADDLKKAPESDEKNNCKASAARISIVAGSGVSIVEFAFAPQNLTIPMGTLVRWTNNGGFAHTSTSDTGLWNSATLAPGATFERTFDTVGAFAYHCAFHPGMTGTITVQ